jgi:hypothetical protein
MLLNGTYTRVYALFFSPTCVRVRENGGLRRILHILQKVHTAGSLARWE